MKNNRFKTKKLVTAFYVTLGLTSLVISNINDHKIKFETVQTEKFKDLISSDGFVVRDEALIEQPYIDLKLDNILFNYNSGDKIPKGAIIATVYNSPEEVKTASEIKFAENQLEKLEAINSYYSRCTDSVSEINKKINETISRLVYFNSDCITRKNLNMELCRLLTKKNIMLGKPTYSEKKLEQIKSEISGVSKPKSIMDIIASDSGTLIRNTDGLENRINYSNISDIPTDETMKSIVGESSKSTSLGKIVKSPTWYVIFYVSNDEAEKIKKSKNLKLSIQSIDSIKNVPTKLESLSKDTTDSGKFKLVLSCENMNNCTASLRKENFKINIGTYYGIKVSKSALHYNKNNLGVYVKYGNHLKFKNIDVIFANEEFVLCDYDQEHYTDENYIQPGDKVVYRGKNLFQGKHI